MSTHTQKGLSLYKNVCFSKMFLRKPDLIAGSMLVKCPVCVCVFVCSLCFCMFYTRSRHLCSFDVAIQRCIDRGILYV